MKIINTFLILSLFIGCATNSYKDKIYKCMEKVIDMGGATSESFDVCQKLIGGKR